MIHRLVKKWPLLAKFLSVLILIMAVPLVILGTASYLYSSYLLEKQGGETANRISSEINNDIDSIMKDYDFILTRMLIEPHVQKFLKTSPDEYLKRVDFMEWFESNIATDFFLKNPYAMNLRIVGANGIWYSTAGMEEGASYEYYEEILPKSGGLVTLQTKENSGKTTVISLCRRVFSGTDCTGILVLNIKGEELNRISIPIFCTIPLEPSTHMPWRSRSPRCCIVDRLSKMFRYATCSPMQAVKVRDELRHVRDYLEIQELRLLKQADIIWDIEENYLEYPMLRLTLQPLVENVFKHGFKRGIEEDSRLIIRAWVRGEEFILSVKDNGVGPEREYDNERIRSSEKDS